MREIIIDDRDVSRNFLVCFFFDKDAPNIDGCKGIINQLINRVL